MTNEQNIAMSDDMPKGCPACETLKVLSGDKPRAGLEQRVLARLHEHAARSRRVWWQMRSVWTGVIAVAVVMATAWVGAVHSGGVMERSKQDTTPAARSEQPPQPMERRAGSFGTAGSMRVPPTLKPLYVPEAPRRSDAEKRTLRPKAAQVKKPSPVMTKE